MTNILDFKRKNDDVHFEDLSLSARRIWIEEANREMEEHLDELLKHGAELKALIAARQRHDQE